MADQLIMPAAPAENDITRLLAEALQEARAGRIHGIAIVTSGGPEHFNYATRGGFPVEIGLGCFMAGFGVGNNMTKPVSSIIPARGDVPRT